MLECWNAGIEGLRNSGIGELRDEGLGSVKSVDGIEESGVVAVHEASLRMIVRPSGFLELFNHQLLGGKTCISY